MKKRYKALLAFGSLAVGTAVINHCIFKMHNKKITSEPTQRFYKFKHGDINYSVHGEGEPLLLIHDIFIGASSKEWERCIRYLSRYYKVYAIDLLGFGASSKPAISYSSYLFVSLINSFITDVIKEKCYVVASSGSSAFAVLATSFNSDNFKKLILISPTNSINFYSKSLRRLIECPILGTAIYNIMSSKLHRKNFLENIIFYEPSNITSSMVESYNHTAHLGGANVKYPIALLISGYLDADISSHLSKITVPTHIVWGAENKLNNVENYEATKLLNSNIGITVINKTRLLPQSEKPREFSKVCKDFFAKE